MGVVLSGHLVDHVSPVTTFRQMWERQLRWAMGTRYSRPKGRFGSGLTFAVPYGILGLIGASLLGHPAVGVALFAASLLKPDGRVFDHRLVGLPRSGCAPCGIALSAERPPRLYHLVRQLSLQTQPLAGQQLRIAQGWAIDRPPGQWLLLSIPGKTLNPPIHLSRPKQPLPTSPPASGAHVRPDSRKCVRGSRASSARR